MALPRLSVRIRSALEAIKRVGENLAWRLEFVRVGGKETRHKIKNGLLSERSLRRLRLFFLASFNQFPHQHFPGFDQVGEDGRFSCFLCLYMIFFLFPLLTCVFSFCFTPATMASQHLQVSLQSNYSFAYNWIFCT